MSYQSKLNDLIKSEVIWGKKGKLININELKKRLLEDKNSEELNIILRLAEDSTVKEPELITVFLAISAFAISLATLVYSITGGYWYPFFVVLTIGVFSIYTPFKLIANSAKNKKSSYIQVLIKESLKKIEETNRVEIKHIFDINEENFIKSNTIIAGDYNNDAIKVGIFSTPGVYIETGLLYKQKIHITKKTVKSYEVTSENEAYSVGCLSNKKVYEYLIILKFKDGKESLLSLDKNTYNCFLKEFS